MCLTTDNTDATKGQTMPPFYTYHLGGGGRCRGPILDARESPHHGSKHGACTEHRRIAAQHNNLQGGFASQEAQCYGVALHWYTLTCCHTPVAVWCNRGAVTRNADLDSLLLQTKTAAEQKGCLVRLRTGLCRLSCLHAHTQGQTSRQDVVGKTSV